MTEADHTVATVADTVRAVDIDADLDGRSVIAVVEVPATSANLGPGYDAGRRQGTGTPTGHLPRLGCR